MWETKFHSHTKQLTELWFCTFLDSRREDKRLWTEWWQAFSDFSLLLISSWMQFWTVSVVTKYLNFATRSKDLFAIFMPCFCPAFLRVINTYLLNSLPNQPPYQHLMSIYKSAKFQLSTSSTSGLTFLDKHLFIYCSRHFVFTILAPES
jgi:thiaminase